MSINLALAEIIPIFVVLIFVIVVGGILLSILKALATWMVNNAQPLQLVDAQVVAKRTEVGGCGHAPTARRTWTHYYCTFEFADGSRQEFGISGREAGLLVEGDAGRLSYQGTRYCGFQRHAVRGKFPLESTPEL